MQDSYEEEVLHVPNCLSRRLDVDLLPGHVHVAVPSVLAVPLSIVPVKCNHILYRTLHDISEKVFFSIPRENPFVRGA